MLKKNADATDAAGVAVTLTWWDKVGHWTCGLVTVFLEAIVSWATSATSASTLPPKCGHLLIALPPTNIAKADTANDYRLSMISPG